MNSVEKTREGNEIYPDRCDIRTAIRGNSNSICANCKHVADTCKPLSKVTSSVNGYTGVTRCDGFEPVIN